MASTSACESSYLTLSVAGTGRSSADTSWSTCVPHKIINVTSECESFLRLPAENLASSTRTRDAPVEVRGSSAYSYAAVDHRNSGAVTNDASTAPPDWHLADISLEFPGINLYSNGFAVNCE